VTQVKDFKHWMYETPSSKEVLLPLVEVIRVENILSAGTFGVLKINGRAFCVTLERPWLDNKPYISCIPCGCYLMQKVPSDRYGLTYEVLGVENRSFIRIHWGNWYTDTKGCILVGQSYAKIFGDQYPYGKRGISNSKNIFKKFINQLHGADLCKLIIQEV
jgi:hypothetical protein